MREGGARNWRAFLALPHKMPRFPPVTSEYATQITRIMTSTAPNFRRVGFENNQNPPEIGDP